MHIGKKEITIVVKYVCDYTNGMSYIDDVKVGTSVDNDVVEYPTLLGILDMAKSYVQEVENWEDE